MEKYKDKLPAKPTVVDVMDNWDNLGIPVYLKDSELCGCLIPFEAHVNAGPNSRKFILWPTDHAQRCHYQQKGVYDDFLDSVYTHDSRGMGI